jgi:F-type H+-transporting ATP synthase subunit e
VANFALLQVARYSALGFGIIYGLYHQAQLSSAAKLAALDREYQHKQSLIEKAKAEYSKKSQQSNPKTGSGTFDPCLPLHTADHLHRTPS